MDDFARLLNLKTPTDVCDNARTSLTKLALTVAELAHEGKKVDPNPTDAQKESGNYKKGHVSWKGLRITIETAAGQYRRGIGKDGKPWKTLMKDMYGYVKGTESDADGDAIDVFLSGDEDLRSELVHVVNQIDPDTGKFDEGKVILGCVDAETAKAVYLRNYAPGWTGFGSITPITLDHFKWWIQNGDTGKEIKNGYFAVRESRKKAAEDALPKTTIENYRPVFQLNKRASDDNAPFTIAVDLDGTLAEKMEPFDAKKIGDLRKRAKHWLDAFHEAGARIIIFTVRDNNKLVGDWLKANELPYDYINENPDQPPDSSGKVFADIYWDDRAYNAQNLDEFGPVILERIQGEEEAPVGESEDRPIIVIEQTRFRVILHPDHATVTETGHEG